MDKITFDGSDRAFHNELHKRVDAYFAEHKLSKKGNAHFFVKAGILLSAFALVYGLIVFAGLSLWIVLPLCLLLGAVEAQLGFNVGHDAIHGAASERSWVNRLLSMTFDVVGASSLNWSTAHNFVHHTYTNIPGVDHDLEPGPWMVFKPTAKPHVLHRFQHLYCWFLYGFTMIVWLLKKDFEQIASPDPRTGKRASAIDVVKVLRSKVLYGIVFVAVPLVFMDLTWWQFLLGTFAMHFAAGVSLAMVFQLAHCVEATAFPVPSADRKMPTGFAAHQLMTTCNFGSSHPVLGFFTGGLDHQVEHHLFPKISHVHYPALSPIVRDTAHAFGLPYLENKTFRGALASHVRTLKRFGRGRSESPVEAALRPIHT